MALVLDGSAGVTFPVVAGGTSAVQASSGKVLQVVQATSTATFSTTSTSFVSTGFSVSITPSSSTSKILIMLLGGQIDNGTGNAQSTYTIYRGGTNIGATQGMGQTYTGTIRLQTPVCGGVLDSPATTSSTTYTVYLANTNSSATVYFNSNPCQSALVAMEIAA